MRKVRSSRRKRNPVVRDNFSHMMVNSHDVALGRSMGFDAYLIAGGLQADAAVSYEDYLQRVVAELGVDLDRCDLSDDGIEALGRRLNAAQVNANSRDNCLTALRAYSDFRSGQPRRSRRRRTASHDQNV